MNFKKLTNKKQGETVYRSNNHMEIIYKPIQNLRFNIS
jgi:hypothetical protein